jgi:hypothetical protein
METKGRVEQHQHSQRMPLPLWRKVRALARAKGLSVNGYINLLVAEAVEGKADPSASVKEAV